MVGTPITITGTYFNPFAPNDVFFGAIKVIANADATGTSITVNVPAGATSVTPITVRNNATGLQASSLTSATPQFTVTNTSILTISPNSYAQTDIITAPGPQSTAAGDFDQDGLTDFIVSFGSSTVLAYLNNGLGGFNNSLMFFGAANPVWVAVADFNNDGIQDIAIADDTFNRTHIGLGNGNGLSFNFSLVLGGAPVFVATGDFNNDGNVDFATLNGASSLNIRLGVGDGTFTTGPTITVGTNASALTVADFDFDSVLDLAVANAGSNNVSILLGLGDGNFSTPDNYNVGTSPQSVIAGDFNQDGNLDLAVANNGSSNVSILLGLGNGTFTNGTDVSVGTNPNVVNIADFDGDGFIDLVSGNAGDISIRLGQGNGAFNTTADISTGLSPQSITIGDFNQDNAADLVLDGGGFAIGLLTYTPLSTAPNALDFDGVDDYVSLGNDALVAELGASFTIETWIKVQSYSTLSPILSRWQFGNGASNFYFYVGDTGFVSISNATGQQVGTPSGAVPLDTWTHVALTYDQATTEVSIYINGILSSRGPLVGGLTSGNSLPLLIGGIVDNPGPNVAGQFPFQIDELRIWSELRACEQILDGLSCELAGTEPNLAAYYQFNESTGTNLPDLAGANDGTLNNFALIGLSSNWVSSTSGVSNTICTFASNFSEISLFDASASLEILPGNTPILADGTDFGTVGGVTSRTFTIQNFGGVTLNISGFSSTNPDFAVNTVLVSVGPVNSATFEVTYTPGTTGTSTISIFSDDCDEPAYTFNVSATFLAGNPFITTWNTNNPGTSSNTQITIPTNAGANYTVYWENTGNPSINGTAGPFTGSATIDFPDIGTYQVEISGDFPRIFFNFGGDAQKILTIEQWGDIAWQTMGNAFAGCSNLTYNATDVPDMTTFPVTETNNMFNGATVFDGDLSGWDMSGVTNMGSMFADATTFNNGNQALTWNTSSAQLMDRVFFNATSFNQDISTWNVSSVTDMSNMFEGASSFDQNIANWNVSSLSTTFRMFAAASAFNNGGVPLTWNTGTGTANVASMAQMFDNATAFNQDIATWNVSNVIDMFRMFFGATAFDQNLGTWNISNVSDMSGMLDNCGMSLANYDATLIGWAAQTVQANVTLGALNLSYCAGEPARNTLIGAPNNWTINGDNLSCPSTDFYTLGNAVWNTNGNWSNTDGGADCNCNPSGIANANVGIKTGHSVTVPDATDIGLTNLIDLQGTGVLSFSNGNNNPIATFSTSPTSTINVDNGTLNLATPASTTINGTLRVGGTGNVSNGLIFADGAIYIHARDGGAIPTATWGASSTVDVVGMIANQPTEASFNQTFGNLTWNCAGQTATANFSGTITIAGNLTLTSTNGGANQLNFGTSTVFLRGNMIHDITVSFNPGLGTFVFNGTTPQTITGASGPTFRNLVINNTASTPTVTVSNNFVINNALTLTNGRLVLGNNDLTFIGPEATLTRTNGWVETDGTGKFERSSAGTNFTFPIGSATQYQPIQITNSAANASARFGTPTLTVPNAGLGSWFVNNGTTSSNLVLLNPQGGGIDATSKVNLNVTAIWIELTTAFASPNYTAVNAFTGIASDLEFSLFTPSTPILDQPIGNRGLYFGEAVTPNDHAHVSLGTGTALENIIKTQFTIEAWIKTSGTSGAIISRWLSGVCANFSLDVYDDGRLNVDDSNPSTTDLTSPVGTILPNRWYHIAYTHENGVRGELFVNGVSVASQTGPNIVNTSMNCPSAELLIGARDEQSSNHKIFGFKGQIDEIRIFSDIRTQAEILSDMASTTPNGAEVYLNFEEDIAAGNQTTALNLGTLGTGGDGILGTGVRAPLWALRVSNTLDDVNQGSLRWAINEANTDTDTDYIDFSIPVADAGYNPNNGGFWTIVPSATGGFSLAQPALVDGWSQLGYTGSNPVLQIDGVNTTASLGFALATNNTIVRGFALNNFNAGGGNNFGIGIFGDNNQVYGNYFGTDITGSAARPNGQGGLWLEANSNDNLIGTNQDGINDAAERNVISGNNFRGGIVLDGSNNVIRGNYIGLRADGLSALANQGQGMEIQGTGNLIDLNVISGNNGEGITMNSNNNSFTANKIGTDFSGLNPIPNTLSGMSITGSSNFIGSGLNANMIAHNGGFGVLIDGSTGNLITGNLIFANNLGGISLTNGGNASKLAPVITSATPTLIDGSCEAGDVVEVFNDTPQTGTTNQGRTFLGTATTVGTTWTFAGTFALGDRITATATSAANNTSPFSGAATVSSTSNGFVTNWSTTDGQITIPTSGTGYNYDITWINLSNPGINEGTLSAQTGNVSLSPLANNDIYQIEITGDFPRIFFNNTGDKDKILAIVQWGNIAWTSMQDAFYGCANLTYQAADAPDLSAVSNFNNMFRECLVFDGNATIQDWDVSSITSMRQTFFGALAFNQPLNNWDVSNVNDMFGLFGSHLNTVTATFNQPLNNWDVSQVNNMAFMFLNNARFNQDISGWQVGNVSNMDFMFALFRTMPDASQFNSPLNNWDVSQVTSMEGMFFEAENFDQPLGNWVTTSLSNINRMFWGARNFNQPINTWDVSGVTNLDSTFYNANRFNQNLNSWDVSSVTSMIGTFAEATDFNGDISNWQVGNVSDMSNMFAAAFSFNQNISAWNVSSVTSMLSMFNNATSFNQELSAWDVSQVSEMGAMFLGATAFNNGEVGNNSSRSLSNWNTRVQNVSNMGQMFGFASSFNQDISGWDVSNVFRMYLMFGNATAFNQDLSAWDISGIVEDPDVNITDDALTSMLDNTGLSELNYDATLIGWATLDAGETQIPTGITLGANGLSYCDAQEERQTLIDAFGWAITGDALNPACSITPVPLALNALLITESSFQANWQSVNSALSYELDISTDGFATFVGNYNALSTVALLENVIGLNPNTTYQYRIRAIGPGGVSDNSNVISVLTLPAAPLALDASEISGLSFVANWQSQANINNFTVEVSTDPAFATIFFTGSAATNSLLIEGLQELSTYYYRVRAVNATGPSAFSNVIMVSTGPAVLNAPSNLNLTVLSNTQIQLDWSDNSAVETGFVIERRRENEADFGQIGTVGANITTFTDNGVSQGITHFYRVKAVRAAQSSDFGETLGALTEVTTALPGLGQLETQVFPNPSAGLFQLTIKNDYFGAVQVEIMSPQGQTLYQHQTSKESRDLSLHFDLQAYTQGIYLLKVNMGGNYSLWKLVKE
ncbi:MAG: BspA family leucine-rich repeat surface protein [Microscillaceae bacterium]|nr:BspA family leucine-rich repeat surface protein [Microscillaceae bacterium]